MGTEKAEAMYDLFVKKMRESYEPEKVKGMHHQTFEPKVLTKNWIYF